LSPIHERMPVLVPPEAFDLWLDCKAVDAETAAVLIAPGRDDLLEAREIAPAVNRVANDTPALIEPLTENAEPEPLAKPKRSKKSSGQASLF
jgi:putative SOS response-associated peptidase YedK